MVDSIPPKPRRAKPNFARALNRDIRDNYNPALREQAGALGLKARTSSQSKLDSRPKSKASPRPVIENKVISNKVIPKVVVSHENERKNLLQLLSADYDSNTVYKLDSILQAGFPVNQPVCLETNQTLLMMCANQQNIDKALINRILVYNPDITAVDNNNRTALHYACRAGLSHIIKPLLRQENIDVNAKSLGGETPFMCAVVSQDLDAIEVCAKNGFNPLIRNYQGQNIKDYLKIYYSPGETSTMMI